MAANPGAENDAWLMAKDVFAAALYDRLILGLGAVSTDTVGLAMQGRYIKAEMYICYAYVSRLRGYTSASNYEYSFAYFPTRIVWPS